MSVVPAQAPQQRAFKGALGRAFALVLGLGLALIATEVALRLLGQPRFYLSHSSPPQFSKPIDLVDDVLMYRNKESSLIRFVYDRDPRGYFGPTCQVDHYTNALGFRGPEFADKPEGVLRLAFLGDSFTFGEGVRFSDITSDVTRALLAEVTEGARTIESLNFGVGGHNSIQSLFVLERYALPLEPDVVVLGYVLNDAEEPILAWNQQQERIVRRPIADEQSGGLARPEGPLYEMHLSQLAWRFLRGRERTDNTLAAYRGLYAADAEWWPRNRESLARIVSLCRERDIPCYVLGWPVLVRLDASYPFREIHEQVGQVVREAGGTFIDLEPVFRGLSAKDLHVHPTDHHPNEIAHDLAARALVERLTTDGVLER